ncbi:MAG: helix-turn-helix transcriptional regulator [Bryobacteraceae bacterium]
MQERRGRGAALKTPEDCFGEVLRELRQKKGVTQEDLAFKSGYHSTYISQLERGRKSPSLRAIMSLAGALNTSGSELLTRLEALLE